MRPPTLALTKPSWFIACVRGPLTGEVAGGDGVEQAELLVGGLLQPSPAPTAPRRHGGGALHGQALRLVHQPVHQVPGG